MATSRFRYLILTLRVVAGIFAGAGMALYVVILAKVTDDRFYGQQTGLTALPIGGAAGLVIWNVVALATTTLARPLWYAFGDFIVAIVLAILGSIGFYHDDVTYLSNGMYLEYDNGPWLLQEILAGSLLLVTVLVQFLLVLLNILENRYIKNAPPQYTYNTESYTVERKEKDIGIDWKSVASSDSSASSIKKPEVVKA